MNKLLYSALLLMVFVFTGAQRLYAQEQEIQQLVLNVEKLKQLRKILQNMYNGYRLLDKGYAAVKDLSQGNFDLHRNFLDGLLAVSPSVRRYHKVAEIIRMQSTLLSQFKTASNRLRPATLSTSEIRMLVATYNGLLKQGIQNLSELSMVITNQNLRMDDNQRITAIDRIHQRLTAQYDFAQNIVGQFHVLSKQRSHALDEIKAMKALHNQ